MRVNKFLPLGFVATILFPIAGLILSIFSIDKNKMNRLSFVLISSFYFFFLIRLPPYGDSYRRYLNYLSYNPSMDLFSFINGHPDVFFYLSISLFRELNIPYFIMPALYGAMMIYFVLASLRNCLIISNCEPSGVGKFLIFTVMLASFDIINYSLGLRYGLAIATIVFAVTSYCRGARIKGGIAMFIAASIHFSMLYIILCFILSRFFKINKKLIIPLSIIAFFLSSILLPLLLSQINFMGIGKYAISGYVESGWANASDNLNTLAVSTIRNLLQLGVFVLFLKDRSYYKEIDRFIYILIPAIFLTSLSFSAIQRFLVVGNIVLLARILPVYYGLILKKIWVLCFFVLFIFTSGVILNTYVQRIAIIWGQLWVGYYTTPLVLFTYSDNDFKHYLNEVTVEGNWTKNKQGE